MILKSVKFSPTMTDYHSDYAKFQQKLRENPEHSTFITLLQNEVKKVKRDDDETKLNAEYTTQRRTETSFA